MKFKVVENLSYGLFSNPSLTAFGMDPPKRRYLYSKCNGDSCNCEVINNFIPHTQCTHTETIHHISDNFKKHPSSEELINKIDPLIKFDIISYSDITQLTVANKNIEAVLVNFNLSPPYPKASPHFQTNDIQQLFQSYPSMKHLLVDLPSIDAVNDKDMTNHKAFFERMPSGSITEMCNFSNINYKNLVNEDHFLNLTVFTITNSDAHPSKPLIVKINN